jgi:predicted nucleotidyltransferase
MRDELSSLFGRSVDLVEKPAGPTPIEAIRHQDTRVNIPTEDLRDPTLDS